MEKYDKNELIEQGKYAVWVLKDNLPKDVNINYYTEMPSKIPSKVVLLRLFLFHRITELGEVSCDLYEQNKIVSAFIMTRATMETFSLLFWLSEKIKEVVETKNIGNMDEFIEKALFGVVEKLDVQTPKPYNILKAVDKVSKKYKTYRSHYDSLCEFTHPNWAGTFKSYTKIKESKNSLALGSEIDNETIIDTGLRPLVFSLELFQEYYNEPILMLNPFAEVCNNEEFDKL